MRRFALPGLFALALAVGFAWAAKSAFDTTREMAMSSLDPSQLPAVVPHHVEDVPPDQLRERARNAPDCQTATRLWWGVVDAVGDDPEAFKAIAECSRQGSAGIDRVVDGTSAVFEQSRVLGVVPTLLDALSVRDVVPILNEVQREKAGDAESLRMLGELRVGLGDVEGAVDAFRQAMALDPDSAEGHYRLGHALIDVGKIPEARSEFREGLAGQPVSERITHAYAASFAFPIPFMLMVLGTIGLGASLWVLRDREKSGNDASAAGFVGAPILLASALGVWFSITGDRMAFGILLIAVATIGAWILFYPLRGPIGGALTWITETAALTAGGQIHTRLSRLPWSAQVGVFAGTMVGIVVFLPLVPSMDAFLVLAFLAAMLLFSTLGALLLRILDESKSLQTSLRWLGIAGTLPFLLFFLYFERTSILRSIVTVSLIDRDSANRIAGYLIVWLAGVGLAVLLARILATSILDPIRRVIDAIARVRRGEFDVSVDLGTRRDEVAALAAAVGEMAAGLREREQIGQTFRKHVNPRVAERLLRGDADLARGREIPAVVLFCDVRGFTSRSEQLAPADVVDVLNEYLQRMEPIISRHDGVVDKFLGDGILALWDVPEPIAEGPNAGVAGELLAARAAVAMQGALTAFNEELSMRGIAELEIGIGIHSGPVIAGPVGSRERQEYTVIGDTVNTAQRIEGQARGDERILVSEAVAERIRGELQVEPLAPVHLKGKREAVVLYKVAF